MRERDKDVAWAAGFLEGEGCFGYYGTPTVTACQLDPHPLERLAATFDGNLRVRERRDNGKVIWEFRAHGEKAIAIMREVRDELSPRRQQKIDEAIEKWEAVEVRRDRQRNFCPQGHDKSIHGSYRRTGRDAGRLFCKACHRERAARKRQPQEVSR